MPFGQLSMWYQSIKDRQIKRAIAENYAVDQKTFGSLLIHHSLVRNICAHHGRLWDRHLNSPPRIPSQLGSVVKRVCSRSSLPGAGRWPNTTPFSWHSGLPPRATA